ncbi:ribonuclease D [Isoptericola sp. S6320L]|uniref:ribonuclease D n=1 Tax=Isoptericola sp. S6320L TaxID=2926411 RepID=UPI001FF27581|nr:ribonuclease D [Isoptericola sp. S6320L]MCK0115584.1 ribonuclease D [Isoptericola sp. S6320L]
MTATVARMAGDLDGDWCEQALVTTRVAIDIETTGLDWRTAEVRTIQVAIGGEVALVQVQDTEPANLVRLVSDPRITKVFHHAAFDLRFLAGSYDALPSNIACTKVAAKIALPGLPPRAYSLAPLLRDRLGVKIDKSQQTSDWSGELTNEQVAYAADDVRHLDRLLSDLLAEARSTRSLNLIESSFAYLPTRVALDLRGAGDVFTH